LINEIKKGRKEMPSNSILREEGRTLALKEKALIHKKRGRGCPSLFMIERMRACLREKKKINSRRGVSTPREKYLLKKKGSTTISRKKERER